MISNLKEEIKSFLSGEVFDDPETLKNYSHDASLFEVKPKVVVWPKDVQDIKKLVEYVNDKKVESDGLSLTPRAAGTCMSGGSLNESIIVDVSKHLNGINSLTQTEAVVLPGTYYRDFEIETLRFGSILPCYTASKNLCAIGGMIGNNAAGEKTLRYGKMEDYVDELKVVFADGNEYVVRPLNKDELMAKTSQDNFEGRLYKQVFDLVSENRELLAESKPKVSKNSAGYYLWNVWDGETFDLTKLIVGSQGTLGIVTEARLRLVPVKSKSKLFVIFMPEISSLGELVNEILKFEPESLESYDDSTMKLAVKFLPAMIKNMKTAGFLKLALSFIPEVLMMLTGGIPKLILLVEFSGDDEEVINGRMLKLRDSIKRFGFKTRITRSQNESEKYWTIRRESFNLLRQHVRGLRTAPFVDDVVVRPEFLPEFLPKMRKILDESNMLYTIAGHAGNGNFHIIPLMDMKDEHNRGLIREVSEKVYDLVAQYGGSITAEHNDGIVRTPYLSKMFRKEVLDLFAETKKIFDPKNIFNPGKKVGGTVEYMESHIVKS